MNDKKLTVIIPVYNTSTYLERCLESIINQSYPSIQIMIINDGSIDESDKIIKSYISKTGNIFYIHLKKNIGVGNARNIGILKSKTPYIAFVDSDDWIDIQYYKKLMKIIENDKSDICISGMTTETNDVKNWKYRYKYNSNMQIDSDFCLHALTNKFHTDISISPIVNNRIYKRSLIIDNNIFFDESRRAQDVYFSFMVFVYAEKVSFCKKVFYHYFQRDYSATHNFTTSYIDDYFYIINSLKNDLIQRCIFKNYENEFDCYVNFHISKIINRMFNNIQNENEQKEYIKYIFKKALSVLTIDRIIDYIDNERLKDFWK